MGLLFFSQPALVVLKHSGLQGWGSTWVWRGEHAKGLRACM